MKNLIISAVWICLASLCFGQDFGEIHGKVVDEFGSPMPGVNVFTTDISGEIGAVTDMDGRYKIKPLAAGTYNVQFSFVSYANKTISGVEVYSGKIRRLDRMNMTLDSEIIKGVAQVEAWGNPLIDAEETSIITIKRSDIKTNPLRNSPVDMIATMVPGAKKGNDGELYFRGSRTGAVQYNIDGVKMTTNAIKVPSSAIGSIAVYTGGMPAKYGDTTGGVVVIETRSFMDLYNEAKYRNL
jgi:hypothetical protein